MQISEDQIEGKKELKANEGKVSRYAIFYLEEELKEICHINLKDNGVYPGYVEAATKWVEDSFFGEICDTIDEAIQQRQAHNKFLSKREADVCWRVGARLDTKEFWESLWDKPYFVSEELSSTCKVYHLRVRYNNGVEWILNNLYCKPETLSKATGRLSAIADQLNGHGYGLYNGEKNSNTNTGGFAEVFMKPEFTSAAEAPKLIESLTGEALPSNG